MLPQSFTVASQILIIPLSRLFELLFLQLYYYQLALLMQHVPFITLCGFAPTRLCLLMYTCSVVCTLLFRGCRFMPRSNVEIIECISFYCEQPDDIWGRECETVNAICANNERNKEKKKGLILQQCGGVFKRASEWHLEIPQARPPYVLSALKTTQFRALFTGHEAWTLSMNNNDQHHLGNFKVSH